MLARRTCQAKVCFKAGLTSAVVETLGYSLLPCSVLDASVNDKSREETNTVVVEKWVTVREAIHKSRQPYSVLLPAEALHRSRPPQAPATLRSCSATGAGDDLL